MTVGSNAFGNLNIFVFEVGMVSTVELFGVQASVVSTVSIHPLLVVPSKITYQDTSRSAVMETIGGAVETKGGRALRTVSMEGTFGVEDRGLLFYLGTGEVRFERFYNEVVRMGDALSADDVDAAVNILTGTPGISLLVKAYDEETTTFYVNFYDFWNDRSFQAQIAQWTDWREHRNGGASGLVNYRMTLKEVGPRVEGGLGETVISGLMAGLTLWTDLNQVIESYTLGAIWDSITAVGDIVTSQVAQTVEAVQAQIDSVNELMGGGGASSSGRSSTSTTGSTASEKRVATSAAAADTASFFQNCANLRLQAEDLASRLSSMTSTSYRAGQGGISWANQQDEGGSPDLSRWEEIATLLDLAHSGEAQPSMGAFFGMDRESYLAWISSGGAITSAAPEIAGSITHVVTETDTAETLETQYGVDWDRILALNRLLPDEALLVGTELEIPILRPRGPQGTDGLPTFGSHVGQAAWGYDLGLTLDVDEEGDLLQVYGPDVLEQGATFLVELFGPLILADAQKVPDNVRASYIGKRLGSVLLSDRRFTSIVSLDVAMVGSVVEVEIALNAVNGGLVRVAG